MIIIEGIEPVDHIIGLGPLLASGYHAPLEIALPIIAVIIILKVALSRVRGRPAVAPEIVVRCSKGHIFTTTWSSLGSLASLRLGFARFQRCPVGRHWALVRPVNQAEQADNDRRAVHNR